MLAQQKSGLRAFSQISICWVVARVLQTPGKCTRTRICRCPQRHTNVPKGPVISEPPSIHTSPGITPQCPVAPVPNLDSPLLKQVSLPDSLSVVSTPCSFCHWVGLCLTFIGRNGGDPAHPRSWRDNPPILERERGVGTAPRFWLDARARAHF